MQQWLVIEFSGNHLKKTFRTKAGFKPAFTMIELIFVIVVLGILAAVAIPRLAASRDDAVLVKGKSQISAIRSGIAMQRSRRLLEGLSTPSFIPRTLDANNTTSDLFHGGDYGNILEYGFPGDTNDGNWQKVDVAVNSPVNIRYRFYLEGTSVLFTYNSDSGVFDCNKTVNVANPNADLCSDLTN